jgi:hypothetical protein
MIELIASIIFIISLGGIFLMLAKKMPVLIKLPQNGTAGIRDHRIVLHFEEKIKEFYFNFKKQVSLHKILSWLKCFVIKIEVQIDHLLHDIRKKAKEQNQNNLKK